MEELIDKRVNELAKELGLPAIYKVKMSVDGDYYRLETNEGDVILADSACEDLYNADSAEAMFCEYIRGL